MSDQFCDSAKTSQIRPDLEFFNLPLCSICCSNLIPWWPFREITTRHSFNLVNNLIEPWVIFLSRSAVMMKILSWSFCLLGLQALQLRISMFFLSSGWISVIIHGSVSILDPFDQSDRSVALTESMRWLQYDWTDLCDHFIESDWIHVITQFSLTGSVQLIRINAFEATSAKILSPPSFLSQFLHVTLKPDRELVTASRSSQVL